MHVATQRALSFEWGGGRFRVYTSMRAVGDTQLRSTVLARVRGCLRDGMLSATIVCLRRCFRQSSLRCARVGSMTPTCAVPTGVALDVAPSLHLHCAVAPSCLAQSYRVPRVEFHFEPTPKLRAHAA